MEKLFGCGIGTLAVSGISCSLLSSNRDLDSLLGYREELPVEVRKNFLSVITPVDRQRFLTAFLQSVRPGMTIRQTVTASKEDGTPILLSIYGSCAPLSMGRQVYNCVFLDITRVAELHEELTQADQRLGMLVDTMQDGVLFYRHGAVMPPQFISDRMLQLLECDYQQFTELQQTKLESILTPEDRRWVFPRELPPQEVVELREIPITTCAGKFRWLLVARQILETEEDGMLVCIVAWDVTQSRRNIRELEIERQRYRLLCEYTQDLLYDYDPSQDMLVLYGNMERVNGSRDYSWPLGDFLAELPESGMMPPEDAEKFRQICLGELSEEVELRLRFPVGGSEYSWFSARHGNIQRDSAGKVVRVLGILSNIDQSKRESEHLRALSEQDSFTGLLNKNSTNQAISEYLAEEGEGKVHALLMMDLDRFKDVNDTYGHQFGDMVLLEFSRTLRSLFRATDILGRVGGDEFLVFMKDVSGGRIVEEKTAALCATFRNKVISQEYPDFRLGCSVGVALFPVHGKDYSTLYERADEALYQAKKNGRSRYEIYHWQSPQLQEEKIPLQDQRLRKTGGILSQALQLLQQEKDLMTGIRRTLEQMAKEWNVQRVWLMELSSAENPISCSFQREGVPPPPLKQMQGQSWWCGKERFNVDGIFCSGDVLNQWPEFSRSYPGKKMSTLQYRGETNGLTLLLGLDDWSDSPQIWNPQEAASLADLAGLLSYYILALRGAETKVEQVV